VANRTLKWFTALGNDAAIASAGQGTFNLLSAVDQANLKGSTVTRILFKAWGVPDLAGARKSIDMGITWLDTDAVVAGAFPDVDVAAERVDWLYRSRMFTQGETSVVQGMVATEVADIRSQRICRADLDQLTLIVDVNSITGGGIFLTFIARILLRLP